MRFGFVVPYADARDFADLASLGETGGWDGIFTWEAVWGVDAWLSLAAAAMKTERVKLGTLLTPVSRVKPWDLATRVTTLDRLSHGRAILSAGLGALHDGWVAFEADEGRRERAEKLDECLEVYTGLLRGQPYSFSGKHYRAAPTDFVLPGPPVQQPRPPVWMVGAQLVGHERQPSLTRAARWDGLLPQVIEEGHRGKVRSPEELARLVEMTRRLRREAGLADESYDVILEADSTGEWERTDPLDPTVWEAAGVTWWVESWWNLERGPEGLAEVRRRVAAGPPR
jgi:alkanesulfonate monooxygenase SsuD/methylene tetrahydromethanopterin reductase-like flavin-dependent oxidoreductase (luciferase family)